MDAESRPIPTTFGRSRYANRRKLPGVDLRTAEGRRFSELLDSFAIALGGRDRVDGRQWAILQDRATIELQLERIRASIINQDPTVDVTELHRLGAQARQLDAELYSRLARPRIGGDKTLPRRAP
jgi:hypothetical protein